MVWTGSEALDTSQFLTLSVPICKRGILSWDSFTGPSRMMSSHSLSLSVLSTYPWPSAHLSFSLLSLLLPSWDLLHSSYGILTS